MTQFIRSQVLPDDMHPDLKSFLAYWRLKKGDRLMPAAHEIITSEIPHLAKGIFCIDINYGSEGHNRYKYSLAGQDVRNSLGMDVVGHYLDEIFPAASYQTLQEDYHDAIATCEPRYMSYIESPTPDSMILLERLLLPLGEEGTNRPQSFIGLHVGTAKGRASLEDTCLPFTLDTD